MLTKKDDMLRLLPMTHELSTSLVNNNDICLGQGTFGIATLGHFQTLDFPCAIKSGKNMHHFDPYFEARVLRRLSGSSYFPYVFGDLASCHGTSSLKKSLTMACSHDLFRKVYIYNACVD